MLCVPAKVNAKEFWTREIILVISQGSFLCGKENKTPELNWTILEQEMATMFAEGFRKGHGPLVYGVWNHLQCFL